MNKVSLMEFSWNEENNKAYGRLYVKNGKFIFKGDADISAKLLFELYLQSSLDKYIQQKVDKLKIKYPLFFWEGAWNEEVLNNE